MPSRLRADKAEGAGRISWNGWDSGWRLSPIYGQSAVGVP